MNKPIYLDYAATTPVHSYVLEQMMPYFQTHFGNAGSELHMYGWEANEAIEKSRSIISRYFNSKPRQVIFTSGATESNNLAIQGYLSQFESKGHLITSLIEHKAVLDVFKYLEHSGWKVTYLKPDSNGYISVEKVKSAIQKDTVLISLMWVNNEIGTILPMAEMIELARQHQIVLHSDATQAIGKLDLQQEKLPDLISFSGHKIYGPKGIGGLLLNNEKITLKPLVFGGNQERELRSGTLPTPLIVGLASAFELIPELLERKIFYHEWKDKIIKMLQQHFENQLIIHSKEHSVPQIISFSVKNVDWEELFEKLSLLAVSNGSACNAKTKLPSHVMKALGMSDNEAFATIRLSMGWMTTEQELGFTITYLEQTLKNLYEGMG